MGLLGVAPHLTSRGCSMRHGSQSDGLTERLPIKRCSVQGVPSVIAISWTCGRVVAVRSCSGPMGVERHCCVRKRLNRLVWLDRRRAVHSGRGLVRVIIVVWMARSRCWNRVYSLLLYDPSTVGMLTGATIVSIRVRRPAKQGIDDTSHKGSLRCPFRAIPGLNDGSRRSGYPVEFGGLVGIFPFDAGRRLLLSFGHRDRGY